MEHAGFIILLLLYCWACNAQDPEVDTVYGTVRGKSIALSSGNVIDSFLGVPYAKAPVGDLRFEAPQDPDPWATPLEAFEPGNACIQLTNISLGLTHGGWSRMSEDCLHVNIYAKQGASNHPVLVYIHGGGFQEGANFQGPGYFLAEKDVVVVALNYRLGVLGFAFTGDETIPANVGILDLIEGLNFIQENIAAFGGDPTRVTISGESAGGAAVGLLLMTPLAAGLFHGAILQSGNEFVPWTLLPPDSNPEQYILEIAETFDCPSNSNQEIIDCLRLVDANSLMTTRLTCAPGYICFGFQPVVDGTVLPDHPAQLRQTGNYNKLPEIIGTTMDEYSFTASLWFPGISTDGISREDYDVFLYNISQNFSQRFPTTDRVDDLYQALRFYYADWPDLEDHFKNRDMLAKLVTDFYFGYGSDLQAKLHSNDNLDVYYYVYDYVMSSSRLPEWMGAIHAADLKSEFGWAYFEENEEAYIHSQANPPFTIYNHTELDKEFTAFFTDLWTNFAKFYNPTPEPVIGPDGNSILWSKYEASEYQFNYLHMSGTPEVLQDFRQKTYAFWTEYMNYLFFGN